MWDWLTPRAANMCLLADPSVAWIRNVSDLLIGGAYALIPFGLVSFLSERRDIQFGWLAWLFALFIALCGATHWMHIWLEYFPHQTAEAYLKAATALASVTTAGAVLALLPDIKRLPTPSMLKHEHERRIQAEVALRKALEERSNRELQKHVETQDLLIQELNHRVKNTLATVQAMASLSFKSAGEHSRASLDAFKARLFALSAAHNLLNQSGWTRASVEDVVRAELAFGADLNRVVLSGPAVDLTAQQAVAFALVVHELTTNSIKYGSLRDGAGGRLVITWEVIEDSLHLHWRCRAGGDPVAKPNREGFGSRMIRRTVERELGGELQENWRADGLQVDLTIPLGRASPAAHAPVPVHA